MEKNQVQLVFGAFLGIILYILLYKLTYMCYIKNLSYREELSSYLENILRWPIVIVQASNPELYALDAHLYQKADLSKSMIKLCEHIIQNCLVSQWFLGLDEFISHSAPEAYFGFTKKKRRNWAYPMYREVL